MVEGEGETGVECKAEKAALPKETEVAAMHTINSQQSGQQTNPLLSLTPHPSLITPLSPFPLAKLAFLTSLNRFEVCRPGGVEMRILQHWLRLFNAF